MKAFRAAVILIALFLIALQTVAGKKQSPLIILQSNENVFNRALFTKGIATATIEGVESIYILNADRSVLVYNLEGSLIKRISSFLDSPGAIAVSPQGYVYLADSVRNNIGILDPNGQILRRFHIKQPYSLALLGNGNLVIASPANGNLLHIYDSSGQNLKSFGKIKSLEASSDIQNRYFNLGKVLVDSSDNIYFISQFALTPTVQKYSSDGKLISEFQVEGKAIDIQVELAKEFLKHKSLNRYGGVDIINSAAIDSVTGHLWICMNGSSDSGVVYEYNSSGKKLNEYAFVGNSPASPQRTITSVKHILVKKSSAYIFTNGDVYRFDLNNGAESGFFLSASVACAEDQGWPECKTNCGTAITTDDKDCTATLKESINQSCCVVVSKDCSSDADDCRLAVDLCNRQTGRITAHSANLNCTTGTSSACFYVSGSNGFATSYQTYPIDGCEEGFCDNGGGCCISAGSPILIDILGNGFNLTGLDNPVSFDIRGEGSPWTMSWTAPNSDDAFLALDRNSNGTIDNGAELFGNYTPQPEPLPQNRNGFIALAEYDKAANGGNGDGKIDSSDAVFASLRLWQDTNHNAISEPGELHTLPSLNVSAIDTDYKESKRTDEQGNRFRYRAKVFDGRHAQVGRWAWDVFFVKQ